VDREELYVRARWPLRSAARWYQEYLRAWEDLEHGPEDGAEDTYDRRVLASWGLIARAKDALPFALEMLASPNPEIRADATSVLNRLRNNPAAIRALLKVIDSETELEPLDAAVQALGRLRAREAMPSLARPIRDDRVDGDTRQVAAVALGKIVGKRFEGHEAIDEALVWLDRNEN
jgi:HEAT repeat protein